MNYNKKVLQFVIYSTFCLVLLSFYTNVFKPKSNIFHNINITSELLKKEKPPKDTTGLKEIVSSVRSNNLEKKFSLFQSPEKLTEYFKDTNQIVLSNFFQKLQELKQGKKRKIRIAFIGDSMIEDDFISLTLRRLLQHEFGGYGIGYLPITSALAGSRVTASISSSDNWMEYNFQTKNSNKKLFLSGRCFGANGEAKATFRDKTVTESLPLNKIILYGNAISSFGVNYLSEEKKLQANNRFNASILNSSINTQFSLSTNSTQDIYGVSFESPYGIIVDNFSFRGISGHEFSKLDSTLLQAINQHYTYDLVILQFGVNLFVKSSDTKFDWYYQPMKKSVQHLKKYLSNADFLMLGCADRAFKYNDKYESAIGLPNIIAMQQKVAFESNIAFYNTFISMGGDGSIASWVESKPCLAYKDYMHPNADGSEILGKGLFSAFMKEYQKTSSIKKEK